VHKLPVVQEALARVLSRFGIERVRTVQDIYLRRPALSPTYWLGTGWRRALAGRFRTTEHFYMPTSAGDVDWAAPLLDVVGRLGRCSLEVGVHPGREEPWRAGELASVLVFAEAARARGDALVPWSSI
jgi:hypothetical protein